MKRQLFLLQIRTTLRLAVLDFLRRPSLSMLGMSLLVTYLGKIEWYITHISNRPPSTGQNEMGFFAYMADDLLVYGGIMLVFWLLEYLLNRRWIQGITGSLSALLSLFAVSNLFWLRATGGQLSAAVIRVGVTRTREILPVIQGELGIGGLLLLVASVGLIGAIPLLFHAKWKTEPALSQYPKWITGIIPVFFVTMGITGIGTQDTLNRRVMSGWRLVADNAIMVIAKEIATAPTLSPAPTRKRTEPPPTLDGVPSPSTPNILFFIMEAAAYRATSFVPGQDGQTPVLHQLAREGLMSTNMRAVLPHTTKSLFSMLCGQYPAMQQQILETADNYRMHCLPEKLAHAGYTSAFFQTANGQFEDRPRLVHNMGFGHFEALQDLRPRPQQLGYFSGDDQGVVAPALKWTAKQDAPFFLSVLTSSSHHPYEIPKRLLQKDAFKTAASWNMAQRYLLLIHDLDTILGQLIDGLKQQGHGDNLIVVAAGDHGEAFGEHGRMQHDNVFWEEGLHVPFVVWAPGRQDAGIVVNEDRSLLDLAPTVLDIAQIPYEPTHFDGRSLRQRDPHPVERYFSCWYSDICVGRVLNRKKLVYQPAARSWVRYDLDTDPYEQAPLIDAPHLRDDAMALYKWYNDNRYTKETLTWSRKTLFDGRWNCNKGQSTCKSVKK